MVLSGNKLKTAPLLVEAQFLVHELASGCLPPTDEVTENMLRLYKYSLFCLSSADPEKIASVLQVLKTLQGGWDTEKDGRTGRKRRNSAPGSITQAGYCHLIFLCRRPHSFNPVSPAGSPSWPLKFERDLDTFTSFLSYISTLLL
jgi:hypothetical protein